VKHLSSAPAPSASRPLAALPDEFEPRKLLRKGAPVVVLLTILVLILVLAPGTGEVGHLLRDADPAWVGVAVVLEGLSCISYVLMFRPIFCQRMAWSFASKIGWSELGAGSIVPASGAAGLALGAWALHEGGMATDRIARRSVAFFLIKSSVNFFAVAILGYLLAAGLLHADQPLWLTLGPAVLATLVILLVVALPRLGPGADPREGAGKIARGISAGRRALIHGTAEALGTLRHPSLLMLVGAVGYWAWDNAVLWATFHAFGASVPITAILMGYLIGQLGGALPIPGGIGGIDGGLIGAMIVFGAPAAAATAAVLVYRVILFWLPLIGGGIGFVLLRRELAAQSENHPLAIC
jgi:uncharacterized membrane protein YbhN (UPF0104 family)